MSYSIQRLFSSPYGDGKSTYQLFNLNKIGKLTFNSGQKMLPDYYYFIPEGDFVTELTFDTKNLYETVTNKGGGFNPLKSLASGVAALSGSDQFASKYINLPEQTSFNVGINGSVKLKFAFGLQEAYNAKKEVVLPILEIIKLYFPAYENNKVTGPYASSGRILMRMVAALKDQVSDVSNAAGNLTENSTEVERTNVINKLDELGQHIVSTFDSLVENVYFGKASKADTDANDSESKVADGKVSAPSTEDSEILKTCNIQIGNIRYNYLFTNGVSWGFSTDNVDEYGYPMEGFVELKNPSFIMLPAIGTGSSKYSFIQTSPVSFGGNIV